MFIVLVLHSYTTSLAEWSCQSLQNATVNFKKINDLASKSCIVTCYLLF